jgi:hypothetical protein
MCVARAGGEQAEYLAIAIVGSSHPGCLDYWDGNWLGAEVEVVAGSFRGSVVGSIRREEIHDFHQQVLRLFETLAGEAVFRTMERWLTIRMVGDGRGHITMEGELTDQPGYSNTLRFRLAVDQTHLGPFRTGLGQIATKYPVIGQP